MNQRLKFLIICAFSFVTQQWAASAYNRAFNQTAFNKNAQLYGNKTANLMELEKIAAYLNSIQNNKTFGVPPFFGISSSEIIAYLDKTPYEQTTVWNFILQQWDQFKSAQPQTVSLLTDRSRSILTNIRNALSKIRFDIPDITKQDPVRAGLLQKFLNAASEQNKLLMVRSTGREDGKELSNAGGNTSIASVPPTADALSNAISEVLVSYMSEKSIGQRLVGKDKHLFDEPFMAVLLQIMMGEIIGTDAEIPKSGVMFSPEAEGETPNVVVIQATFGHNEGVVNGLVPVDTYYTGPENITHPLISIKTKRLAATLGKEGLDFVSNNIAIQRASTLDPETVLTLKSAAQFVQNYYNNFVDIEFVIFGNTIYFVQARPLEAKKFEASYIKPDFITQNSVSTLNVIPVGVGNAAVRVITHHNQVILADNIRQALDTFLFKTPDQDAIQAVIINESAPATSHEATQFRRLGKPVLFAQDINRVKSWLQQLDNTNTTAAKSFASASSLDNSASSRPLSSEIITNDNNILLIDAQQALIVPFTPMASFPSAESTIEIGWHTHPIAKKVSLMPSFITKLPSQAKQNFSPKEFFRGTPATRLIETIKTGDPEQAIQALRSLLHRVFNNMQHTQHIQKALKGAAADTNSRLMNELIRIFLAMTASAHEIESIITKPDASRLERLYPITFLEALIRQLPEPNRLVNDYSFVSILKSEIEEQKIVSELNLQGLTSREYITQYAKAGTSALVSEVQHNWNSYLQSLANIDDPALRNRFAQLMLALSRLKAVPLWLNTSFEQAYAIHNDDPLELTYALLGEYDTARELINRLQELQLFYASFNISAFEDPAAFNKQFIALREHVLELTKPPFLEDIETTTNLGKMAALQVMHSAVATFDASIKALTGSNIYTDTILIVERFNMMLQDYLTLLKAWTTIPNIKNDLETMIDRSSFSNLQQYIRNIELALRKEINPRQLESSPGFNVAGAALGSKANWLRSAPNPLTFEDAFTLIHQNLLVIEGVFATKTDLRFLKAPELVHILNNNARRIRIKIDDRGTLSTANLIGILFEGSQLIYYYNLPQRNHSSTFRIIYNLNTRKTSLAIQFLGDARNRWALIGDTLYVLEELSNLRLEKPVEVDPARGVLSFIWQINTEIEAITAFKYLETFANYATSSTDQNLLEIISEQNNINKQSLINEILNKIPQHPNLLLYISNIETIHKNNPTAKGALYQKLIKIAPETSLSNQHTILTTVLRAYKRPENNIKSEDLLSLLYDIDAQAINQNILHDIIENIFNTIDSGQIADFINTKFLNSTIPLVQERGIQLIKILIKEYNRKEFISYIYNRFIYTDSDNAQKELLGLIKTYEQDPYAKDAYQTLIKIAPNSSIISQQNILSALLDAIKRSGNSITPENILALLQELDAQVIVNESDISDNLVEHIFTQVNPEMIARLIKTKFLNSTSPSIQEKGLLLLKKLLEENAALKKYIPLDDLRNQFKDSKSTNIQTLLRILSRKYG